MENLKTKIVNTVNLFTKLIKTAVSPVNTNTTEHEWFWDEIKNLVKIWV